MLWHAGSRRVARTLSGAMSLLVITLSVVFLSGTVQADPGVLCDSKAFFFQRGGAGSTFGLANGWVSRYRNPDTNTDFVEITLKSTLNYDVRGKGVAPDSENNDDIQVGFKSLVGPGFSQEMPLLSASYANLQGYGAAHPHWTIGLNFLDVHFTSSTEGRGNLFGQWAQSGLGSVTLRLRILIANIAGSISSENLAYFDLFPCGQGGSPFVAPWNGTDFILDNNILPQSDEFGRDTLDVRDRYRLHQPLVAEDGRYALKIIEFEDDHTRLDQLQLLVVTHPEDQRLALDPAGQLYTFEELQPAVSAIDNYDRDVTALISVEDGSFYEGWRGDSVNLRWERVLHEDARLLLKADEGHAKQSVDVYVQVGGSFEYVTTIHPRYQFAWEVVDLSPYVPAKHLTVKLVSTRYHKLDLAGLDFSRQSKIQEYEAPLVAATHSGSGDVLRLISAQDSTYADIVPGQEVLVEFGVPPMDKVDEEKARSFILVSIGHYTHKYQPYLGENVALDGLHLSVGAYLAHESDVFFWDFGVTSITWEFGDETQATGESARHEYAAPGEYRLIAFVSYDDESSKAYGRTIVVRDRPG